ncbi:MAG TPA: EAL domain-containing protein [Bacillus sp. (in: firmicutes)]|uniref:putative bifunctional diguanylate cyclase/phosphodiesterase n=1 Tax=Bacillus litorisediminis TaxID=2922713 RepID=UPI001FAE5763|nr:EAL domain-containing protein [Bacillus litorisediminis]HWO75293.1 EAL domain-containing protein [Bacillus sp. (in: firmicutes)]
MCIFEIFKQERSFFLSKSIKNAILSREWKKAVQNGYITFYLQPKYSFTDEKVVGAEALIRWNHPKKGPISPSEFIPLLEKRGLIQMIDTWMLESVISQIGVWNKLGLSEQFQISVNVSADTLQSSQFIKSIKRALKQSEVLPNQLEIEITERVQLQNIHHVLKNLKCMQKLGIQIALDDFGIGYSCLTYLTQYPVDTLKIDRSFVWQLPNEKNASIIIRGLIQMAYELGMKVVAEGVESKEQYDFLKNHGCHTLQGFFKHKPIPVHEFETQFFRKPAAV